MLVSVNVAQNGIYRVERIVLCGMTAQPPAPEIHKTALGAEDAVAWTYESDTLEAVRKLKDEGYKVFAIEQAHGSTPLQNLSSVVREGEKFAVVFGHEVKGVQQEVVDAADGCLELPQFGTKHSLNVSVTAGIVIWEFAQKMMSFSPLQ